jgi:hypothetical protein
VPDVVVTRHLVVAAPIERAFDTLSAEDVLPTLLHRYLFVPGVTGTADVSGPWNQPGRSRTVALSGGGTVREEITSYERPRYFAYRVEGFPAPFALLVRSAQGRWWLATDGARTIIRWSYSFDAARPAGAVPLRVFAHLFWRGYMRAAMRRLGRVLSR